MLTPFFPFRLMAATLASSYRKSPTLRIICAFFSPEFACEEDAGNTAFTSPGSRRMTPLGA